MNVKIEEGMISEIPKGKEAISCQMTVWSSGFPRACSPLQDSLHICKISGMKSMSVFTILFCNKNSNYETLLWNSFAILNCDADTWNLMTVYKD